MGRNEFLLAILIAVLVASLMGSCTYSVTMCKQSAIKEKIAPTEIKKICEM